MTAQLVLGVGEILPQGVQPQIVLRVYQERLKFLLIQKGTDKFDCSRDRISLTFDIRKNHFHLLIKIGQLPYLFHLKLRRDNYKVVLLEQFSLESAFSLIRPAQPLFSTVLSKQKQDLTFLIMLEQQQFQSIYSLIFSKQQKIGAGPYILNLKKRVLGMELVRGRLLIFTDMQIIQVRLETETIRVVFQSQTTIKAVFIADDIYVLKTTEIAVLDASSLLKKRVIDLSERRSLKSLFVVGGEIYCEDSSNHLYSVDQDQLRLIFKNQFYRIANPKIVRTRYANYLLYEKRYEEGNKQHCQLTYNSKFVNQQTLTCNQHFFQKLVGNSKLQIIEENIICFNSRQFDSINLVSYFFPEQTRFHLQAIPLVQSFPNQYSLFIGNVFLKQTQKAFAQLTNSALRYLLNGKKYQISLKDLIGVDIDADFGQVCGQNILMCIFDQVHNINVKVDDRITKVSQSIKCFESQIQFFQVVNYYLVFAVKLFGKNQLQIWAFSHISQHCQLLVNIDVSGKLNTLAKLAVQFKAEFTTVNLIGTGNGLLFVFVCSDIIKNKNQFPPKFKPAFFRFNDPVFDKLSPCLPSNQLNYQFITQTGFLYFPKSLLSTDYSDYQITIEQVIGLPPLQQGGLALKNKQDLLLMGGKKVISGKINNDIKSQISQQQQLEVLNCKCKIVVMQGSLIIKRQAEIKWPLRGPKYKHLVQYKCQAEAIRLQKEINRVILIHQELVLFLAEDQLLLCQFHSDSEQLLLGLCRKFAVQNQQLYKFRNQMPIEQWSQLEQLGGLKFNIAIQQILVKVEADSYKSTKLLLLLQSSQLLLLLIDRDSFKVEKALKESGIVRLLSWDKQTFWAVDNLKKAVRYDLQGNRLQQRQSGQIILLEACEQFKQRTRNFKMRSGLLSSSEKQLLEVNQLGVLKIGKQSQLL